MTTVRSVGQQAHRDSLAHELNVDLPRVAVALQQAQQGLNAEETGKVVWIATRDVQRRAQCLRVERLEQLLPRHWPQQSIHNG
jgi:hypothetical protein